MITASRTVTEELQQFCDMSGHPVATIWDRYNPDDRSALVHKLKIIFAPPPMPIAGVDNAAIDWTSERMDTSEDDAALEMDDLMFAQVFNHTEAQQSAVEERMDPDLLKIVNAIWNQRKYCNGVLLMAPVFVACVPTDVYEQHGFEARQFELRPIFRIAKCFKNDRTENCCTVFVDDGARVYCNWDDFCQHNEYGNGVVLVAPTLGIYRPHAETGRVQLTGTVAHHSLMRKMEMPTTVVGVGASALTLASCVPLLPAVPVVLLAGATVAGIGCGTFAVVSGIQRLFSRGTHEQTISLADRESRAVWLTVAGGSMGMVAGAAMQVVQRAATNGVSVHRFATSVVTSLSAATIATNGIGVANGFYCIFLDRRNGRFSYMEAMQLSASLYLFTHSVRNFQTARAAYNETQASTLNTFAGSLSKRQQKIFTKMLKETIRLNGENGAADVIRSLRSIGNHRGFFQDLFKINKQLNENKIKISFDSNGRPVLNGEVPFESSQLRAELQQNPGTDVLRNMTSGNQSGGVGASVGSGYRNSPVVSSNNSSCNTTWSTAKSIGQNLSDEVKFRIGGAADGIRMMHVVSFAFRCFQQNQHLFADRLSLHFDNRFVDDVCRILLFLAEQAHEELFSFMASVGQQVLFDRLSRLYESRWLEVGLRVSVGSVYAMFDKIMAAFGRLADHIRDMRGFRQTVLDLLQDMSETVVERLLELSKVSFGSMLEMARNQRLSFDAYFVEVLEIVTVMATQSGIGDLSVFVLLMERKQVQELHKRVSQYFVRMRDRSLAAKRCTLCSGSFAMMTVT